MVGLVGWRKVMGVVKWRRGRVCKIRWNRWGNALFTNSPHRRCKGHTTHKAPRKCKVSSCLKNGIWFGQVGQGAAVVVASAAAVVVASAAAAVASTAAAPAPAPAVEARVRGRGGVATVVDADAAPPLARTCGVGCRCSRRCTLRCSHRRAGCHPAASRCCGGGRGSNSDPIPDPEPNPECNPTPAPAQFRPSSTTPPPLCTLVP